MKILQKIKCVFGYHTLAIILPHVALSNYLKEPYIRLPNGRMIMREPLKAMCDVCKKDLGFIYTNRELKESHCLRYPCDAFHASTKLAELCWRYIITETIADISSDMAKIAPSYRPTPIMPVTKKMIQEEIDNILSKSTPFVTHVCKCNICEKIRKKQK